MYARRKKKWVVLKPDPLPPEKPLSAYHASCNPRIELKPRPQVPDVLPVSTNLVLWLKVRAEEICSKTDKTNTSIRILSTYVCQPNISWKSQTPYNMVSFPMDRLFDVYNGGFGTVWGYANKALNIVFRTRALQPDDNIVSDRSFGQV